MGHSMRVRCCIVGGGPAGMMLGYLLGRAGIDVVVLEKHADFFRDFRGDTVHPSTLQVMDELGLIDGFLRLPHQQLQHLQGLFGGTTIRLADLSRLPVKYPFIAFMPQWDFLNFLRQAGERFPSLKVMMGTEAVDLIREGGRIAGVRANTPDGMIDIAADLTVACDGRHSTVRERAGLKVEDIGAPMDVLWFRAGKDPNEAESVFARVDPGKMMVTFDRGDYWQCAYVIPKGGYEAVKARGLPALLDDVVRMAPVLQSGVSDVRSWDDIKLLTVAINRLKKWSLPGAALHRRCRACDVADRRRRRQSRRAGRGRHGKSSCGQAEVGCADRGRTRRGAGAARVSGEADAAHAGGGTEQCRQPGAESKGGAAEAAAAHAGNHRGALAAGSHRALHRDRRASRACAFACGRRPAALIRKSVQRFSEKIMLEQGAS